MEGITEYWVQVICLQGDGLVIVGQCAHNYVYVNYYVFIYYYYYPALGALNISFY